MGMSEEAKMGFMADGRERHVKSIRRDVVREIRARHAQELERASLFDRMRIEARIREEIRAALVHTAPPEAVY
jgi:hypothetical protein